ncbi:MAG: HlyD family efflux transporter periplasmic adaptor subunit [Synechococcales cyanobacterium CRU_2_2]|nr:HlyD family efflux transporter periplasmic adaptor subunit [Synechococcales cyanobacterium CRU_2_2]
MLEIHAEDGEAVGAQGILDVGQTQAMNVVAEVYETDIPQIRPGQAALISSSVLSQPLSGRVKTIGLRINKKDVLESDPVADTDARVVEVEIRLDDPTPLATLTNLQVNVTIDTADVPSPGPPAPSFLKPAPASPAPSEAGRPSPSILAPEDTN